MLGRVKHSETRSHTVLREHIEAVLERHVVELFERIPILCGFSVRRDLELGEVALCTWPGFTAGPELYLELVQALAELAEERPDAAELLRGRTFVRTLH